MAARVTQHVVELVIARPTYSPTVITGAGVTQHVAEVVVTATSPSVRLSQHVVELVVTGNPDGTHGDTGGGGATAVTHAWGYAT